MSKIIASAAIRGSHKVVNDAEAFLDKAISEKGKDQKVEFPETAFYFPMAYALLGVKVQKLGDVVPLMAYVKSLLPEVPTENLWLPYLGNTLDSGVATMLAEEIIVALRYLYAQEPQPNCNGFFTDTILRTLGLQLVDGRMPGFAAILGAAPDNKTAVKVIRELQKRSILIFVGSSTNGRSIIDQLLEENIEMGWDTYIVPYGRDTITGIYPLNWAIRGAMTFGGVKPGNAKDCLLYTKNRVFAFGLTLGEVDDVKYATGAGAINMGFPVIADTPIPEIRPTGICTYEHVVHELDYDKIVPTCIEVRGVKVKVQEIPIPVPYAAAFEGETVRAEQMQVQFGGKYTHSFEFIRSKSMDEVEDGKIELKGPDCDAIPQGSALPLGIVVDVAGRKMKKDFEPILERQLHRYINHAMGIFHMGQRDMTWLRISKDAFKSGFRLKHFGEIVKAELKNEYGALVDKVQITIYTDKEAVDKWIQEARMVYTERDARVAGMTDESVDIFYSCTLCQSYAPNHVCIISPERLGLCGAYNWLDGRANYEINPTGANKPVTKKRCIDEVKGQWDGVNEFVYRTSNQNISKFNAYSLMEDPMTSCGCFECLVVIIPEANGVMVVNREYPGMTPCGMAFSTLAGSVGGGNQTPGFLGVGRLYLTSKKFISADGGLQRIVWMPKELKQQLHDALVKRAHEIGDPDFVNKIADESIGVTAEEILPYLEQVAHPALTMDPLM
ncbi:MAG: CO dehydrogenase/CO-methylating acetyl-CoA synthase complex subunit beta [Candidatus Tectomicrobia bacterium]|uniref:CO-methylating acetyl-CoA synthase n=1 Tax=Tectimicrobiota bacterium TaxID=2528274 RepID=A0A933GLS3_UNCTE|nr:CO dehydrogenase/CO-methylating acetyl-CoA synthase complex subunit beta [Candidatus Tectomicrobia bacterium]